MSARVQLVAFWVSACFGAGMVACVTANQRRTFDEDDETGAPLRDAESPIDGGAPTDTATEKPPFSPDDEPISCSTTPCAVEIVAGENHFCARMSDGTARCWGDDRRGSLGGGEDAGGGVVRVAGLADAKQLSAGGTTTCALVSDGRVWCWGGNDTGQLGLAPVDAVADDDRHPIPAPVALGGDATRVDVGQSTACAVLTTGEVWCWGDNSRDQLARSTSRKIGAPAKAELGDLHVTRTAAGSYTAFAVTEEGAVVSWGAVAGAEGSVAVRKTSLSSDPAPLPIGLSGVTSFSVSSTKLLPDDFPTRARGIAHACAIVDGGDVRCWGDTAWGATGAGLAGQVPEPRSALVKSAIAWPREVTAAGDVTCVRLTDGTVQCAGDNASGALGRDPATTTFSLLFEPASAFHARALRIAASAHAVCAIVEGGAVVCWGSNERKQLGQNVADTDPHPSAVPVSF